MSLIGTLFARLSVGAFLKIFKGVSGPVLDYYKEKERRKSEQAVQDTKQQGIWADALVKGAETDVENRKLAMQERAANPWLAGLYFVIIAGPVLYYTLFWLDTIFADVYPFTVWDLHRAPTRLEEFGQYVIVTFIGGGSAVYGILKGVRFLKR